MNEITAELKGLKAEVEQFTKDSSQYSQVSSRGRGLLWPTVSRLLGVMTENGWLAVLRCLSPVV